MIIINAKGMGGLEYSLNGVDYQDDNIFTGLESGLYTIYIKDKGGCGTIVKEVLVLNYPKFFTPNGDGINDTWRIKFSHNEPNMLIKIYDRFGKVVASFGANHHGWD